MSNLKAAFELSDDEVERTMAMVSGRPNFLKTTQMLRARRDKHWDMWIKLTKKMAAVFSTADDVDMAAASIEERMSKWLNEKVTAVPEEPTLPEPPEPPLPASQAEVPSSSGDVSQPPQRCEYSAEERDSRIAELERIAQADVDRRFGPKSWRAVFTPADKLRRYKKGRLKKGTRKQRHNVFGPHIRCYTIDVRLPGDVQDDFLRSIDEACCRKGARILLLGQAPTEANACGCRHVCCEGGGWSSRQKVGKKWVSMAPVACSCAGGLGGAEASAHDGAAEAEIGMGAEGEGEGEDAAVMQCEEEEGESEGEEGEGEEGRAGVW